MQEAAALEQIKASDRGGEEEHPRFHVEAETEGGTRTTGTAAHSLEGALERVHWGELDR